MNRNQRRASGMRGTAPINPDTLDLHACECGSQEFVSILQLRRLPTLLSPMGRAGLIAQEKLARCAACGAPAEWKLEEQPKIVTLGGDGNVLPNVPLENNLSDVGKPEGEGV